VGPFRQTETCRTFLLRAFARANYIDVNTTRKNGQTGNKIAVGDPWSVVLDWLKRISSIKTVLNMHLGVH
jgi:hypothetical protein